MEKAQGGQLTMVIPERECYLCGSKEKICVHHVDWDRHNVAYDNIVLLCESCCGEVYRKDCVTLDGLKALKKQITERINGCK